MVTWEKQVAIGWEVGQARGSEVRPESEQCGGECQDEALILKRCLQSLLQ